MRIVLVRPRNPLNIGAAARAMLNFGFGELWLVDPYSEAFRTAKSAMGAAEVLANARVTKDPAEAYGDCSLVVATSALTGRNTEIVRKEAPAAAAALRTHLEDRKAALVFGSEKFGLSREDLSFCDWIFTIPTAPECPSMNLGQAVAVCCYEIARRSAPVAALKTPASASAEDRDRIFGILMPILRESGFLFEGSEEAQGRKIRRWVTRLRLAPKDALLLQGMLRQIQWKLDHTKGPGTGD
ncbi:MAG: TrmJ/YjtD family RNA methyltransferase [Bryobacterales bacterium]